MRTASFMACGLAVASLTICAAARAAGPEVRSLFPAGGQRGTTVEVKLGGKFDNWPVQSWVDRPGLTITPAEEKGKLSVAIAADATPGRYWIRFHDAAGATPPQPFIVGTLPELVEKDPNDAAAEAQVAETSTVVVNGRFERGGDVDTFALPLTRGQTLVASLAGHETLGSPMDSVLHLVSPGGYQLAYNHDRRGLDPEIDYVAPSDGSLLARVFAFPSAPNSSVRFAGGENYVYRLTLTTGGFVDYPWPLAVTAGRQTPVELVGWNVPESLRTVPVQSGGKSVEIADPQLANVTCVAVEPHETPLETEPNDRDGPQSIAIPATVTGRIESESDVDAFAFAAAKGQALVFQLESRSLGYPLDGVLEVLDADGKSLARVDDTGGERDATVSFTAPADGTYRIVASDLNRAGSSRHVYRLRMVPAVPDFAVTADALAYTVEGDKPAEITLAIDRQHGFAEPIEFTVSGLPEFVTAAAAKSEPSGDSAKSVKLTLTSTGGPFSGPIRIQAKSVGDSPREHEAEAAIPNHTVRTSDLWLTATLKPES